MKQCPVCQRLYADDTQIYCLDDGTVLTAPYDSQATLINAPVRITDARTEVLPGHRAADTEPYPPVPVLALLRRNRRGPPMRSLRYWP